MPEQSSRTYEIVQMCVEDLDAGMSPVEIARRGMRILDVAYRRHVGEVAQKVIEGSMQNLEAGGFIPASRVLAIIWDVVPKDDWVMGQAKWIINRFSEKAEGVHGPDYIRSQYKLAQDVEDYLSNPERDLPLVRCPQGWRVRDYA